jgi:predicted esterase
MMAQQSADGGPHRGRPVLATGTPLEAAHSALVLVHGRGADAESILELQSVLPHPGMAYLAPQAAGNSWYPYSFLAPLARNEPYLSSGLRAVGETVGKAADAGIAFDRIFLGGFSQGACLAAEFVARNARRYGGLLVFSGGLIGPLGMNRSYNGSLDGTPVFIGCSNRDPHIPIERVEESEDVLRALGGDVSKVIYPDLGHTIVPDEIDRANRIIRDRLDS